MVSEVGAMVPRGLMRMPYAEVRGRVLGRHLTVPRPLGHDRAVDQLRSLMAMPGRPRSRQA